MHGQQWDTVKCRVLILHMVTVSKRKTSETNSSCFADKNLGMCNPAPLGHRVYLLGLDAVQCCREVNTSCTPNSGRIGKLESTCERTMSFINRLGGLLCFCDLLLCPCFKLGSVPNRPCFLRVREPH